MISRLIQIKVPTVDLLDQKVAANPKPNRPLNLSRRSWWLVLPLASMLEPTSFQLTRGRGSTRAIRLRPWGVVQGAVNPENCLNIKVVLL